MLQLIVAETARQNLIEIGEYTEQVWGENQKNHYLTNLESRMFYLLENPEYGQDRGYLKKDYYSYQEGKHLIFYTFNKTALEVVAVLHERMDYVRHL